MTDQIDAAAVIESLQRQAGEHAVQRAIAESKIADLQRRVDALTTENEMLRGQVAAESEGEAV